MDDAVARAIRRAMSEHPDLAAGARAGRPKTWGAIAAHAIKAFGDISGRAPTDAERRAVWDALWRRIQEGGA